MKLLIERQRLPTLFNYSSTDRATALPQHLNPDQTTAVFYWGQQVLKVGSSAGGEDQNWRGKEEEEE